MWTSAPGTYKRLAAPDLQDILTRRGEHVYGAYGEGRSPSPVFSWNKSVSRIFIIIFHPGEEYSTKFLTRRNPPRGPVPYYFNPFSYTFIDKNSISFNCCKCTVVYIRASVNRFGPFYKRSWEISLSVSYTVHTLQVVKSLPLVPEAWKWYLFRAEPPRIGVSPLPASCPPWNFKINQSTLFKHGKWLSRLVFRHAV